LFPAGLPPRRQEVICGVVRTGRPGKRRFTMAGLLKWILYGILLAIVVWIIQVLIKWIRRREKDIDDE
jgi:cytoskeletal protein RodZ